MKITLADFMESLTPKKRVDFVNKVATECEVQTSALSQWKKRIVPKYARSIIQKYAPIDVKFIWGDETKEAA